MWTSIGQPSDLLLAFISLQSQLLKRLEVMRGLPGSLRLILRMPFLEHLKFLCGTDWDLDWNSIYLPINDSLKHLDLTTWAVNIDIMKKLLKCLPNIEGLKGLKLVIGKEMLHFIRDENHYLTDVECLTLQCNSKEAKEILPECNVKTYFE